MRRFNKIIGGFQKVINKLTKKCNKKAMKIALKIDRLHDKRIAQV